MEYKSVNVNGFDVEDEGNGVVSTIVSLTGIADSVSDVIEPGAYARTLKERKPKGIWHHKWDQPVSKTLESKELLPGDADLPKSLPDGRAWPSGAGGLLIKTQFNLQTQAGRDAYENVKFYGPEQEWSIGYKVVPSKTRIDTKSGRRHIGELDLYEYSPVLVGTMPMAHTVSVKSAQEAFKRLSGDGVGDGDIPLEIKSVLAPGPGAMTMDTAELVDHIDQVMTQLVDLKTALSADVRRQQQEEDAEMSEHTGDESKAAPKTDNADYMSLFDDNEAPAASAPAPEDDEDDEGADDPENYPDYTQDDDPDLEDPEDTDVVQEFDSLADAVTSVVPDDEDMIELAIRVDAAQDKAEMLAAAEAFTDYLAKAINEAPAGDRNEMRVLAQTLQDMVDDAAASETEMGTGPDPAAAPAVEEEMPMDEKSERINIEGITDFLEELTV